MSYPKTQESQDPITSSASTLTAPAYTPGNHLKHGNNYNITEGIKCDYLTLNYHWPVSMNKAIATQIGKMLATFQTACTVTKKSVTGYHYKYMVSLNGLFVLKVVGGIGYSTTKPSLMLEFSPAILTSLSIEKLFSEALQELLCDSLGAYHQHMSVSRVDVAWDTAAPTKSLLVYKPKTRAVVLKGWKNPTAYFNRGESKSRLKLYDKKRQLLKKFGIEIPQPHLARLEFSLRHSNLPSLANLHELQNPFTDVLVFDRNIAISMMWKQPAYHLVAKRIQDENLPEKFCEYVRALSLYKRKQLMALLAPSLVSPSPSTEFESQWCSCLLKHAVLKALNDQQSNAKPTNHQTPAD